MGIADVIPGVSGGTIALITGIYEELITTVDQLGIQSFLILKKEGLPSTRFIEDRISTCARNICSATGSNASCRLHPRSKTL